jgi:methylated-DNA-[protein]-cysteine S-methyltransferase
VLKAKKMQKTSKYTIFKTRCGYFGLAAIDKALMRTSLPLAEREKIKLQLLYNLPDCQFEKDLFKPAQKRIAAYFEGVRVDFGDIPIVLNGLSLFTKRVLTTCRAIEFGQTVSYGRLAELAGKPGAARTVGNALAKNPLPLIIPCHRVLCADGSLGGFSAPGSTNLKKKMLQLEESFRAATVRER